VAGPIAVIPSRWGAQRFPGKPLALLRGKPMVRHVVDRCTEARCFELIIVATDDERIAEAVRGFGGQVLLTSPQCPSGTDRVAEVALTLEVSLDTPFVNVQGDEPAVHPEALRQLARAFDDPSVRMATLVRPLKEAERANPNVVKAVLDEASRALYFSRADVPFARSAVPELERWAHLGLYGYRKATLLELAGTPPTALERSESLEQLRALGHGVPLLCVKTTHASQAVDVPADVALAEAELVALANR